MSGIDPNDLMNPTTSMSFLDSPSFSRRYDMPKQSPVSSPTVDNGNTQSEVILSTNDAVPQDNGAIVEDISEEQVDKEVYEEQPLSSKMTTNSYSTESSQFQKGYDDRQPSIDDNTAYMTEPAPKITRRKSLRDYPVVTTEIRNNLLRCRDDLYDFVSDICDENKRLNDMYEEIRRSPLAAEIKQQYEDAINEWSDKFNELEALYNASQDDNNSLQNELARQQRENENLRNQLRIIPQLEQDLKSATIRRDVLERELQDAQNELDSVQEEKRRIEAQNDQQRKDIRSLNIELNTLKAERKNRDYSDDIKQPPGRRDYSEKPSSNRRDYSSNRYQQDLPPVEDEGDHSVILYKRPPLPKREPQPTMTAVAIYSYEGSRDYNSAPMRKGTTMTVIKMNETKDWALVSFDGITTWEPVPFLEIDTNENRNSGRPQSIHTKSIDSSNMISKRGIAIADFEGIDSTEMSVRKGEIVQIIDESGEWLLGTVGTRKGWLPVTYIEMTQ